MLVHRFPVGRQRGAVAGVLLSAVEQQVVAREFCDGGHVVRAGGRDRRVHVVSGSITLCALQNARSG